MKRLVVYTEEVIAMDWRHNARCRPNGPQAVDPELFFPIGNTGQALLQIEEACAVCRQCPVRDECLDFALATRQETGVWGGMSEDQRRALMRRQTRKTA